MPSPLVSCVRSLLHDAVRIPSGIERGRHRGLGPEADHEVVQRRIGPAANLDRPLRARQIDRIGHRMGARGGAGRIDEQRVVLGRRGIQQGRVAGHVVDKARLHDDVAGIDALQARE